MSDANTKQLAFYCRPCSQVIPITVVYCEMVQHECYYINPCSFFIDNDLNRPTKADKMKLKLQQAEDELKKKQKEVDDIKKKIADTDCVKQCENEKSKLIQSRVPSKVHHLFCPQTHPSKDTFYLI